jgi:hypothetical protein
MSPSRLIEITHRESRSIITLPASSWTPSSRSLADGDS